MDVVVRLPECDAFDVILVVLDKLPKMRHYIPFHATFNARGLAALFLKQMQSFHRLPLIFCSDTGPQFLSTICGHMYNHFEIDRRMRTALHPQLDSRMEQVNVNME